MSILRKTYQNNYTTIDNAALTDQKLTWAARGMLAYLLTKPDGWNVRESQLVKASDGQGVGVVRSALACLEGTGYLWRGWGRDGAGRLVRLTDLADHPAFVGREPGTKANAQPITESGLSDVGFSDVGKSQAIVSTQGKQEEHVLKDVATQGVARDEEPSEQGIDQPALVDLPEAKTPRPRKVKTASVDDPDYGDRAAIIRRACGVTGYATPATRGQLGNFNKEFAGTSAAAFERMVDLALENIARRCGKSRAELTAPSLTQLREFTSAVKAGRSVPLASHAPINLDGR